MTKPSKVFIEGDTVYILGERVNKSVSELPFLVTMGLDECLVSIDKKFIGEAFREYYGTFVQRPGETWRHVVGRVAAVHGLEKECLQAFDELMKLGEFSEDNAAFIALYDWDCTA
jgi:hypothetical protein